MVKSILKHYRQADLLVKTKVQNIFWISFILAIGMLLLTPLLYFSGAVISSVVTVSIALIFSLNFLFLRFGFYRFSANFTYFMILLGVSITAFVNRSGVIESDLFQTIVFLAIGLGLLTLFGTSSIQSMVISGVGVCLLVLITYLPVSPEYLPLTVAQLNKSGSPTAILIIFLLLGLISAITIFQNNRLLLAMRAAMETIEANNSILEDMVEDRTSALKTILDNTGQGFFTFTKDFEVAQEYSRGCVDIFKRPVGGENVISLLFPNGGDDALEFHQGLSLYFTGKSKASVIFDLLEKETFVSGRYIQLEYKEAGNKKILCILTDVTTEKLLEEKNKKEEERQALIFRALNNKLFFSSFIKEADILFNAMEGLWKKVPDKLELEAFLRQIHTFKGNAGFFGFERTQEVAHDFEYALSDSLVLGTEVPYQDLYIDIKKSYYQELQSISEILGQEWLKEVGGIVISREDFSNILQYMKMNHPKEVSFIHSIERFNRIPLKDLFSRFPYIAHATADKLGKKLKPIKFEVEDVKVSPERLGPLAEVCVHLINNMVDHGIEPPYERENLGKSSHGQLELIITVDQGLLQLVFRDDGRGIDVSALESRARKMGLLVGDERPETRELFKFLFADAFSTREEITEISGRGVGLAAVSHEVKRLGGAIEVNTRKGEGTSFILSFPLRKSAKLERS